MGCFDPTRQLDSICRGSSRERASGTAQAEEEMSELGKRDAAGLGEAEGLAKRQAGEAGLEGGTSRAPLAPRRCARACRGAAARARESA